MLRTTSHMSRPVDVLYRLPPWKRALISGMSGSPDASVVVTRRLRLAPVHAAAVNKTWQSPLAGATGDSAAHGMADVSFCASCPID